MAISGLSSMGFLYNRGAPEEPKDDMGRPGAVKPMEKNLVLKTIGIVCVCAGLGFGLSKLLVSYVAATVAFPAWYEEYSCPPQRSFLSPLHSLCLSP